MHQLKQRIEALAGAPAEDLRNDAARATFLEFREALTRGEVRAASKENGSWKTNEWVKRGILLGFRIGVLQVFDDGSAVNFVDKDTFPPRRFSTNSGVRLVPGGSSIREGAYVGATGHEAASIAELARMIGLAPEVLVHTVEEYNAACREDVPFDPGNMDGKCTVGITPKAYAIALGRCHTDVAPWYVVPSDSKWYRNWAVARLLLEALRGMQLEWPGPDYDVEEQKARLQ